MQRLNLKRLDPAETVQLLAGHYIRLLRWAAAEEPAFVPNSNAQVKSARVCAQTVGALTILFLISTAGYFAYRHKYGTMDAAQILQESIRRESASLEGQTEYQVAHIEEISADGRVPQQATVDAWKDGDIDFSDLLFGQPTKMLDQSFGNAGALYNQGGPRALQVSVKATF
jgi:hypothetical protein